MKYQKRVVAFIDFLGFKEIIKETATSPSSLECLMSALRFTRKHFSREGFEGFELQGDKRVTHFSDSIIISFGVSENSGVFYALLDIQHLLFELAGKGYLCRGGITFGDMIHSDDNAFGPAFVAAYELESQKAKYPRVIVDETIVEIGATFHGFQNDYESESSYIRSMLSRDSDGLLYVDYFEKCIEEFDDPQSDLPVYFDKLGKLVEIGLQNDDERIKAKYEWLANKHNKMAAVFPFLQPGFAQISV